MRCEKLNRDGHELVSELTPRRPTYRRVVGKTRFNGYRCSGTSKPVRSSPSTTASLARNLAWWKVCALLNDADALSESQEVCYSLYISTEACRFGFTEHHRTLRFAAAGRPRRAINAPEVSAVERLSLERNLENLRQSAERCGTR